VGERIRMNDFTICLWVFVGLFGTWLIGSLVMQLW
jgi:hypothetical protein